jgi:chromosome segregation ATPase
LNDANTTDAQPGREKPSAKTAAERQAALRRRRQEQGREQSVFWLTSDEKAKVKDLLAGRLGEDAAKIAAERDALAEKLDSSRTVIRDQREELSNLRDEWLEMSERLRDTQAQLTKTEQALKEKPAKTFKVSELANRSAVIAKALSHEKGYRETEEVSTAKLKAQADLAKKFSTDIKQARSRLASLVAITAGAELLEQSKAKPIFGG